MLSFLRSLEIGVVSPVYFYCCYVTLTITPFRSKRLLLPLLRVHLFSVICWETVRVKSRMNAIEGENFDAQPGCGRVEGALTSPSLYNRTMRSQDKSEKKRVNHNIEHKRLHCLINVEELFCWGCCLCTIFANHVRTGRLSWTFSMLTNLMAMERGKTGFRNTRKHFCMTKKKWPNKRSCVEVHRDVGMYAPLSTVWQHCDRLQLYA